MSVFCFIDEVAEVKKGESLTAYFTLKGNEEFLKDHFNGFPVMPGVLLLEALKQAASALLEPAAKDSKVFYRLSGVEDAKFGQFVKPGSRLKIFVKFLKSEGLFSFFDGRIDLIAPLPEGASQGRALTAGLKLARAA